MPIDPRIPLSLDYGNPDPVGQYQRGFETAQKVRNAPLQRKAAEIEIEGAELGNKTKKLDALAGLLGSVKDEVTYNRARQMAIGYGLATEQDIPPQYNPADIPIWQNYLNTSLAGLKRQQLQFQMRGGTPAAFVRQMSDPAFSQQFFDQKNATKGLAINPYTGQPEIMPGYNAAVASTEGAKKDAEQQAILGSAADIERQKKIGQGEITDVEKKASGQKNFSSVIKDMRGYYSTLDKLEAIPSTRYDGPKNIQISTRASRLGQALGKAAATEEQRIRQSINNSIPRLMTAIKNSSGMSAQEINSIPEMQLLKASVGDPSQPIETVVETLDSLERLYGVPQEENVPTGQSVLPKTESRSIQNKRQLAEKYGYTKEEIDAYLKEGK